jgi:hypothetical protein
MTVMHEYKGKWKSKKYPSKMVCGTLLITQFDKEGHPMTQIEMQYGGMFKGYLPVQLEHKGELPPTLEVKHEQSNVKLYFEETELHTISGRYEVESPVDTGVFSLKRKKIEVMA